MDEQNEANEETPKKGKKNTIVYLILAVFGAIAGFYIAFYDPIGTPPDVVQTETQFEPLDEFLFIEVPPITVSLPANSSRSLLRIGVQLDVAPIHEEQVRSEMPRTIDILNTYLHSLDETEFDRPDTLHRLREQMLHRARVVSGQYVIRDLLITEFILN